MASIWDICLQTSVKMIKNFLIAALLLAALCSLAAAQYYGGYGYGRGFGGYGGYRGYGGYGGFGRGYGYGGYGRGFGYGGYGRRFYG